MKVQNAAAYKFPFMQCKIFCMYSNSNNQVGDNATCVSCVYKSQLLNSRGILGSCIV